MQLINALCKWSLFSLLAIFILACGRPDQDNLPTADHSISTHPGKEAIPPDFPVVQGKDGPIPVVEQLAPATSFAIQNLTDNGLAAVLQDPALATNRHAVFENYEIRSEASGRYFTVLDLRSGTVALHRPTQSVAVALPQAYEKEDYDFVQPLPAGQGLVHYDRSAQRLYLKQLEVKDWTVVDLPTSAILNPGLLAIAPNTDHLFLVSQNEQQRSTVFKYDFSEKSWESKELPERPIRYLDLDPSGQFLLMSSRAGIDLYDKNLSAVDFVSLPEIRVFSPAYWVKNNKLKKWLITARHALCVYDIEQGSASIYQLSDAEISTGRFLQDNTVLYGVHRWNTGRVFTDTTHVTTSYLVKQRLAPDPALSIVTSDIGYVYTFPLEGKEMRAVGKFADDNSNHFTIRLDQ